MTNFGSRHLYEVRDVGTDSRRAYVQMLVPLSHQDLIDRLPMAAYAVRAPDGVIVWFNSTAARLWGRQPKIGDLDERFCGAYRLYRSDGSYMAHSDTPVAEAMKSGISVREEDVVIQRPDGSRVTVCVYIDPVRNGEGRIVGVTNFFYDITDRRARELHIRHQAELLEAALQRASVSEAELRKSEKALREADQRKDEFLAMLAHELRNPLAPIANASELLSRALSEDSRAQDFIGMIKRQVLQLTCLLDDLLDLSRITQGRIQLKKQPLELAAVITQAIETFEPLLHEKGQRLSTTLATDAPLYVNGDAARLVECVGNVLNNAIKYTEPGGEISVCTRGDPDNAFIEVSDTGSGIAPELLPSIFELFVQSDCTLARSSDGLGIGLAVVKRLVQLHHGDVCARSGGLGQGSTFEIRLPRVERPSAPLSEAPRFKALSRRVLIVDDNVDAADSLAAVLEIGNHDIRVAYNGTEALAFVKAFKPDVGLIDLGLPGMSGYELARRLRAMKLNGLHLVALTGYGQAEDYARSREAGFNDYLIKPADLSALERALAGIPAQAAERWMSK